MQQMEILLVILFLSRNHCHRPSKLSCLAALEIGPWLNELDFNLNSMSGYPISLVISTHIRGHTDPLGQVPLELGQYEPVSSF